jgi:hypothetical protein
MQQSTGVLPYKASQRRGLQASQGRKIEQLDWEDEEDLKTRKTTAFRSHIKKDQRSSGDPFFD